VQRQNAARGALETNRSRRLQKLWHILHRFRELDNATRQRATDLLRQMRAESQRNLADTRSPERSVLLQLEQAKTRLSPRTTYRDFHEHDGDVFSSNLVPDEALEPLQEDDDFVFPPTERPPEYLDDDIQHLEADHMADHDSVDVIIPELEDPSQAVYPTTSPVTPSFPSSHYFDEASKPEEDLAPALVSLYAEYRKGVSAFAAIAAPRRDRISSFPPMDPDSQAEIVMTKAQYQLTVEEGDFWDKFTSAETSSEPESTSDEEEALISLTRTSEMMSDTFQRRMNPPTHEMYNECKEIIRAMGVPCIDTSGAFEAEALACSMVLSGLADFVASEDTVCSDIRSSRSSRPPNHSFLPRMS